MNLPSPIEELRAQLFSEKGIQVYVKRDDLIHPTISGNKWRKLKFNVEKFKQGGYDKLLTFGGAFSNHIAATAAVGKMLGIETIGIIRGDELTSQSNKTLQKSSLNGMDLIFTSREEYQLKEEKYFQEELRRRHGNVLIVPEGGANFYGVLGCVEIMKEIPFEPTHVFTAAGTATTATGLLLASNNCQVIAVSALKGGEFLNENVENLLRGAGLDNTSIKDKMKTFSLITNAHFGGYAKHSEELIAFMNEFHITHKIDLDKVYTAKMMYALIEQIRTDQIKPESKVVALHTGGLQGNSTVQEKLNF